MIPIAAACKLRKNGVMGMGNEALISQVSGLQIYDCITPVLALVNYKLIFLPEISETEKFNLDILTAFNTRNRALKMF